MDVLSFSYLRMDVFKKEVNLMPKKEEEVNRMNVWKWIVSRPCFGLRRRSQFEPFNTVINGSNLLRDSLLEELNSSRDESLSRSEPLNFSKYFSDSDCFLKFGPKRIRSECF